MTGAVPSKRAPGFDGAAAVTRSLLGYGVIAGPIYLVVAVAQALSREGFDLGRHSVSLLANGSGGWVQTTNFVVVGLMVLAAATGVARALRPARWGALLLGVYGVSLLLAAAFPADPMDGFPPGTPDGAATLTTSGVLHLAAGGIGFLALGAAFLALGAWFARRDDDGGIAAGSRIAAAVLLVAFVAGAATATSPVGIALLWVAVTVGWVWLAILSVALYRTVPHPDADRRT